MNELATENMESSKEADRKRSINPILLFGRLPSETRVYGLENGSLNLASRVGYNYDEEDFAQETNQNIASVIQHDKSAFSASFIIGRGNLTSTTRHDVTGHTASVTTKLRYDIAGSPVAQMDPLNRKVRIDYGDVFNDSANRNVFAYPTTLTDPANNSSTVKYRYDTGANVRAQSPAPAANTQGKITEREYDSVGRLSKNKVVNNGGAYTRYEYPTNGIQSKVYSTIIDTNGNGADPADEVLSESFHDGAGRVRMSRTKHPGSSGGFSGKKTEYDILGRVKRQTVATEMDESWNPAGDDPVFLWTHQKYDWMGRVIRTINTDGADSETLNPSDILISYDGCGCAGGLVTTIQSESVPRDDQPGVNARRTQKIYSDILGRDYKTELLNWDGRVYKTNVSTLTRLPQLNLDFHKDQIF